MDFGLELALVRHRTSRGTSSRLRIAVKSLDSRFTFKDENTVKIRLTAEMDLNNLADKRWFLGSVLYYVH